MPGCYRSLAASAPIWLFDHLVPCTLYNQIVTQDFNRSEPNCVSNIQRSWKVINSMADRGNVWVSFYWLYVSKITQSVFHGFLWNLLQKVVGIRTKKKWISICGWSASKSGNSFHLIFTITIFLYWHSRFCAKKGPVGSLGVSKLVSV